MAARESWQLQYAQGEGFFHLLAWRDGALMLAFYSAARRPAVQRGDRGGVRRSARRRCRAPCAAGGQKCTVCAREGTHNLQLF
ncbi:Assimilatory nitrate reductase large subunit (EC:1.7.99.4) [Cronobacter malonaticus 507]|nr:Assimilatory nitrate reductase large subunit (EC:1.7.99.4) [Cronobacter malonaticus 507]